MRFDIVHTFKNISLTAYEELFFDEAFNTAMMPTAGVKRREVLSQEETGGVLRKRLRVFPERDFPPPVNKLIKGELSYVELAEFDRAKHRQTWTSEISVMPDKIKMAGEISFRDVPGGVERRITGECSVDLFGIGKMVEKLITDNLKETYDKIAAFTQRYIDDSKQRA